MRIVITPLCDGGQGGLSASVEDDKGGCIAHSFIRDYSCVVNTLEQTFNVTAPALLRDLLRELSRQQIPPMKSVECILKETDPLLTGPAPVRQVFTVNNRGIPLFHVTMKELEQSRELQRDIHFTIQVSHLDKSLARVQVDNTRSQTPFFCLDTELYLLFFPTWDYSGNCEVPQRHVIRSGIQRVYITRRRSEAVKALLGWSEGELGKYLQYGPDGGGARYFGFTETEFKKPLFRLHIASNLVSVLLGNTWKDMGKGEFEPGHE